MEKRILNLRAANGERLEALATNNAMGHDVVLLRVFRGDDLIGMSVPRPELVKQLKTALEWLGGEEEKTAKRRRDMFFPRTRRA